MENLEYHILHILYLEHKKLSGNIIIYDKTEFEKELKTSISDKIFSDTIKLLNRLELIKINPPIKGNILDTFSITTMGFVLKQKLEERDEKFIKYLKAEKELIEQGDGFLNILFFNQTKEDWRLASNSFHSLLTFHMNKSK
jgi:hypothetical protein